MDNVSCPLSPSRQMMTQWNLVVQADQRERGGKISVTSFFSVKMRMTKSCRTS